VAPYLVALAHSLCYSLALLVAHRQRRPIAAICANWAHRSSGLMFSNCRRINSKPSRNLACSCSFRFKSSRNFWIGLEFCPICHLRLCGSAAYLRLVVRLLVDGRFDNGHLVLDYLDFGLRFRHDFEVRLTVDNLYLRL